MQYIPFLCSIACKVLLFENEKNTQTVKFLLLKTSLLLPDLKIIIKKMLPKIYFSLVVAQKNRVIKCECIMINIELLGASTTNLKLNNNKKKM